MAAWGAEFGHAAAEEVAAPKPVAKAKAKSAPKKKKRSFKNLSKGEDAHPAAKIHWWRIVLDESHNIKDPATAANKACTGLTSGRRWCVSGTPMTSQISDLIGQFKFLGLAPLDRPAYFATVANHSGKLLALLRRILIRHSKNQRVLRPAGTGDAHFGFEDKVVEEPLLELPPLTSIVEHLDFGPGEQVNFLPLPSYLLDHAAA